MTHRSKSDKYKSKIKAFIEEENGTKHYWYSFTNENKKHNDYIMENMRIRIEKRFGIPLKLRFYENDKAGYSGNLIKNFYKGIED